MNKYKVIYYVVAISPYLVSVFLLIGMTQAGLICIKRPIYLVYFALIPVIEWIEKKANNLASEKGE